MHVKFNTYPYFITILDTTRILKWMVWNGLFPPLTIHKIWQHSLKKNDGSGHVIGLPEIFAKRNTWAYMLYIRTCLFAYNRGKKWLMLLKQEHTLEGKGLIVNLKILFR